MPSPAAPWTPSRRSCGARQPSSLKHLTGGEAAASTVDRFQEGLRQSSRWWSVYDDVMPMLNYVKAAGIRTGLVSTGSPPAGFRARHGLFYAFPVLVGSVEEGIEKPSPRLFEIALERAGVEASEAIYVGDDYRADVVGARAAGLTPVLLDRNDRYLATDCAKIHVLDG